MRVCMNTQAIADPAVVPGETVLVHVPGKTDASYFLFTPPKWSPTNPPAPLVFAFSPSGNGKAILRQLRPSCASRGWFVVGCSNLQNKWHPNDRLMEREIILDVRRRVPHDRAREYLAGFSGGGSRAYGLVRTSWNEFAGIISYCGWLGVYDPELVYPSRLAVAMINGDHDRAALRQGNIDRKLLRRFGIRATEFQFAGGHGLGPPPVTDEALKWLEADWQANQKEQVARAVKESTSLLNQAETAFRKKKYADATEFASRMILDYSFTVSASAADELLVRMFATPAMHAEAMKRPSPPTNAATAQIFLARARNLLGFPSNERIGYCELAWVLNPNSPEAAAQLAAAWADNPAASSSDLQRAELLAAFSVGKEPAKWYFWHARAMVAARKGQQNEARDCWQKALEVSPSWAKPVCESHLKNLSP
jgi:tetratricopeptide (TPR) repeat protein